MRKIMLSVLLLVIIVLISISTGSAVTINLYDWAFYVDGTTYENFKGNSMPTTGALTDGLGTLTWSTNAPGTHNFIAFFDHEIDEKINTWSNEYGMTHNSLATGQSWEIDEPGYFFGDIFDNVLAGALDNTNGVPSGWEDDVSMAMGWNFSLTSGQTADITLYLTDTAPATTPSLYLSHTDPYSADYTIYYSSILDIQGTPPPPAVPEPGTFMLLCCGITGLIGLKKKFII